MSLKEKLNLTDAQFKLLFKAAGNNQKLLFSAEKSLDKTLLLTGEQWDLKRKRAYIKEYINSIIKGYRTKVAGFNKLSLNGSKPIEGEKFKQICQENDKIIASIQKKHEGPVYFDCEVCGKVAFHSQLACWWRRLEKRFK